MSLRGKGITTLLFLMILISDKVLEDLKCERNSNIVVLGVKEMELLNLSKNGHEYCNFT